MPVAKSGFQEKRREARGGKADGSWRKAKVGETTEDGHSAHPMVSYCLASLMSRLVLIYPPLPGEDGWRENVFIENNLRGSAGWIMLAPGGFWSTREDRR
jgi:hypothetical protein